jgi:hypothetical protein
MDRTKIRDGFIKTMIEKLEAGVVIGEKITGGHVPFPCRRCQTPGVAGSLGLSE